MNIMQEVTKIRQALIYAMLSNGYFSVSEVSDETGLDKKLTFKLLKSMLNEGSVECKLSDGKTYYWAVEGFEYAVKTKIHCVDDDGSLLIKRLKEAKEIVPFRDPLIWLSYGVRK